MKLDDETWPTPAKVPVVSGQSRLHDLEWFVRHLVIVNEKGQKSTLANLRVEQEEFIEAWKTGKNLLVIKARQLGITTITVACMFWLLYTCPDPIGALTIAHESGAAQRVNEMLRWFIMGLPPALRPALNPDNQNAIGLVHNRAGFMQLMAGGRGQGRSRTYQVLHGTEAGLWPKGSAAINKGQDNEGADFAVWQAALATLHKGPYRRLVMESTADGPGGLLHETFKVATASDEWIVLFFAWYRFEEYANPAPPGFALTAEEEEMLALYADKGMTVENLVWRRSKIEDEGYSRSRFRKEYPSHAEEPFMLSGGTWFDSEHISKVVARARPDNKADLQIYEEYDPRRKYFGGMDTSGGTGRDWAVIQIVRDDGEQVARWHSQWTKPDGQAIQADKLATRYGRCTMLCEANNFGKTAIRRMAQLGTRLWKDEKGKDFWSQRGQAGQSKDHVYTYAQPLVDNGHFASADPGRSAGIHCPMTLGEMLVIRESDNGNIEAPGDGHDDHIDGLVLAWWCGRRYFRQLQAKLETRDRAKMNRARALMGR